MKHKFTSKSLLVVLLVSMAMVSMLAAPGFAAENHKTVRLAWGSASMGSSAQVMVSALGFIAHNEHPWLQISAQASGGSLENPRLLRDHKLDVAHTTEGYRAMTATGPFEGEPPVPLMTLFPMYGNYLVFLSLPSSGITKLEDLEGETVAIGPPASGTSQMSTATLQAFDLFDKIKKVNLGYNQSADALRDGTVDAVALFVSGNVPAPALLQLVTSAKVTVLKIDPEKLQSAFDSNPGFVPGTIKAGTFQGLDEDLYTLVSWSIEYTDARLPEDVAYTIVKSLFENADKLATYHKLGSTISLESAMSGFVSKIPVHPGAARYFKEQGVWRDDLTVGEIK